MINEGNIAINERIRSVVLKANVCTQHHKESVTYIALSKKCIDEINNKRETPMLKRIYKDIIDTSSRLLNI